MKKNLRKIGIALLLLFASGLATCAPLQNQVSDQGNTINWMVSDWPPVYILHDGKTPESASDLGAGRTDVVLKEIIANLPQYQHHFTQANLVRTWSSMLSGQHQCDAASFKNPAREKLAYFTPVGLGVSVGVVVREDKLNQLQFSSASVSLAQLISQRHDLTGYLDAGRSFGPTIDTILASPDAHIMRQVESHNGHLLQMLDFGRMDYTLENPIVVEYLSHHISFSHELAVLPIDEVPALVPIYVACPRNYWGKQVINDIAQAVSVASRSPAFRNAYFTWLGPDLTKKHRAEYDSFFNNLGKKPDVVK